MEAGKGVGVCADAEATMRQERRMVMASDDFNFNARLLSV
jgi:hypothetical protein